MGKHVNTVFIKCFDCKCSVLLADCVHVCVDDDEREGDDEVEDEPDVDHLDVGRVRQVRVHLETEGGQAGLLLLLLY